jgi:beta-lactamase regulating signal transducer with metallopeptidase domain
MESLVHAMLSNAVVAAILVAIVAVIGRTCRRPALIHALCLVVMLKLVTPPLVQVSLPVGLDLAPETWSSSKAQKGFSEPIAAAEMSRSVTAAAVNEQWDEAGGDGSDMALTPLPQVGAGANSEGTPGISTRIWNVGIGLLAGWSWEQLVLTVALAGAFAWWTLAFLRIMRFQRLMKEIEPASEEWQSCTAELGHRLGLAEAPTLCLVPGRVPPMLWAMSGRPRLLVPSELWSATTLEERTGLLLHELAHLKRRDHWVRWLELFVAGLYWWHPAVWWSRGLLREAEEQCCDAWVIWAMPQGAKTYATALLAAIEFVSGARTAPAASLAASGNGHVSCLKRRLKMIVRARTPKGLSWAGRLAVLGLTMLLLPLAPSWGQKSDAESKQDEGRREDKSRATAERLESRVKELIDRLTKELGPVGEEIRKTLEKSIDEIHETIKKEGLTADDVRKAVEKSHNEIRKAFEKGGPINRELRESIEQSRRDMREEWERARGELRSEMRQRLESRRQQERVRDMEKDDAQPNNEAREELEKARNEVRALEQQLRQANRRLVELQRRMMPGGRGGRRMEAPAARVAPDRAPEDQPARREASPRSPRTDAEPARRVNPPEGGEPGFPAGRRSPGGGEPGFPAARRRLPEAPQGPGVNEKRLRELEQKLERVLKELEGLKADKKAQEPRDSSARPRRPGRAGAPTIL